MIGGGQLSRMSAEAATALGIGFRVLAERPDDAAAQVVADTRLGSHTDREAILAFAEGCDVVTFDHEHVPAGILEEVIDRGIAVRPGPDALVHAQDKGLMRERLAELGVPCPRNAIVTTVDEVVACTGAAS